MVTTLTQAITIRERENIGLIRYMYKNVVVGWLRGRTGYHVMSRHIITTRHTRALWQYINTPLRHVVISLPLLRWPAIRHALTTRREFTLPRTV